MGERLGKFTYANFKYILKKLLDIKLNMDNLKSKNKNLVKNYEYIFIILKLIFYSSEECNKLLSDWAIHFFRFHYFENKDD